MHRPADGCMHPSEYTEAQCASASSVWGTSACRSRWRSPLPAPRSLGVDTDAAKVAAVARRALLRRGRLRRGARRGRAPRLHASADYAGLAGADAVLICVPTPLSANREPDLRAAARLRATRSGRCCAAGQLVVLESTSYPGTTRERVAPLLEAAAGCARASTSISPSRPSASTPAAPTTPSPTRRRSSAGLTEACGDRAEALYRMVCERVVRVSSPESAELTKLLENIFRAVNIALVNELALLTDRMGIDIWEVIDAASTKPYGFMRFTPGPGMGGHCLPVDPFYLAWRAREFDMPVEFIELAGKLNQQMPYHCVAKLAAAAQRARARAVRGARIAVLGVSYKPGVGDVRESPALKIIELLRELGADVVYHDPLVARARRRPACARCRSRTRSPAPSAR